ncbi:hypothetical protein [Bradyrhizobium macuxiense]|uniref:hypothetical protein n=1 Tax=Bradyrhizobium macuxiense TaxID=1755647 RepID=UPI00191943D8|nr:hypothetical protein [Bradyrhizobium macuxiense]
MTQGDLEALFPGRPVASKGPTLSPIYKGPQYSESCMYTVRVPSPTSRAELTKFATITVVQYGGDSDGPHASNATFASMRSMREKVDADQKLNYRTDPLSGIGDEAFVETSPSVVKVYVRKGDLIYVVNLDVYSPQSQPNVVALATQAAKRWKPGAGMIEAATPIAANGGVDIPDDTRTSSVAPVDQWPDACALLAPEDVRAIFGDMKIDPPRKTMGQIKYESRIDHVEALPKPIRCVYQTSRTDMVNGEKRFVVHDVTLIVSNMAANDDISKKFYQVVRKTGDAKTDVAGLGDEASINVMNSIYIRKGRLVIEVRVGGEDRDRDLHDDATRRVNELAKLVSAKMP